MRTYLELARAIIYPKPPAGPIATLFLLPTEGLLITTMVADEGLEKGPDRRLYRASEGCSVNCFR